MKVAIIILIVLLLGAIGAGYYAWTELMSNHKTLAQANLDLIKKVNNLKSRIDSLESRLSTAESAFKERDDQFTKEFWYVKENIDRLGRLFNYKKFGEYRTWVSKGNVSIKSVR